MRKFLTVLLSIVVYGTRINFRYIFGAVLVLLAGVLHVVFKPQRRVGRKLAKSHRNLL